MVDRFPHLLSTFSASLQWFLCAFILVSLTACEADQVAEVDEDDVGGVVMGPDGPEAGVWVIAETHDLPTRFARIVVTDGEGRYLIPDLPDATYDVWVRGYGLVDSPKQEATPGSRLDLEAVEAPDPQAAAQYYPSGYWFSLVDVPSEDAFPGTGQGGNGFSPDIEHRANFLRLVKSGMCLACHGMGNRGTREFHPEMGAFETHKQAWERRIQSGQAGASMVGGTNALGWNGTLGMFADWTQSIADGAVPPEPPRPEGIERNVVITQWDWAGPTDYLHDLVSTDRRDPTVNPGGKIYGALEASADYLPVLDPETHEASRIPLHTLEPQPPIAPSQSMPAPSPYWGEELIWDSRTNVHNPMMDAEGRVWVTATARAFETPGYCREGSDHPSAQVYPLERSTRHLGVYDPETGEYTPIPTCFSTHHLMFAEDEQNTLWTSGGGPVAGYLDTQTYLETGDEEAAQGWTPFILDTNGNGKRDDYVEPDETVDPALDKRLTTGLYAVSPAPDGSVWGSTLGYPGGIVRLDPGENPSQTAITEYYALPLDGNGEPIEGYSPRGMDIDRNGVAWVALASGHLGRFDRSQCEGPLNGPEATGQHCPEGWTFHEEPLPQLDGLEGESGSAESSYYTWVDQQNVLGLGPNTPINTGNESEGLLVWNDGEWVVMRVPYPTGFYTKWMDGRIDDPDAGWKGRGIWATLSTRAPFHTETGKGTTSQVYKFQLRPDPLAN
ncbi:MAG: hypothetical protein WD397_07765 [Wenzhouxiangellaceae bacterium]